SLCLLQLLPQLLQSLLPAAVLQFLEPITVALLGGGEFSFERGLGSVLEQAPQGLFLFLAEGIELALVPEPLAPAGTVPFLPVLGRVDGQELAPQDGLLKGVFHTGQPVALDAEDGGQNLVVQRLPQLIDRRDCEVEDQERLEPRPVQRSQRPAENAVTS